MSALNAATDFRTRTARSDRAKFDHTLARLGNLPRRAGDEVEGK